jgi:hypothetical protein
VDGIIINGYVECKNKSTPSENHAKNGKEPEKRTFWMAFGVSLTRKAAEDIIPPPRYPSNLSAWAMPHALVLPA